MQSTINYDLSCYYNVLHFCSHRNKFTNYANCVISITIIYSHINYLTAATELTLYMGVQWVAF